MFSTVLVQRRRAYPFFEHLSPIRGRTTESKLSRADEFSGNLTVFGDWWVAESLLPKSGGYRQTTFTWHPATVKPFSDEFNEEFGYLCEENQVSPEQSRLVAIQEIDRALTL
jgi:hypothetical protein